MAEVYAQGTMSKIVAAGSREGLMNLGYAPPHAAGVSSQVRQVNLVRMVFTLLDLKPGDAVLDIGCGRGGALVLLADSDSALKTCGLNIERLQLLSAKRLFKRRGLERSIHLVQADAQSLPFGSGSFDAIYSIELSAHIDDKLAMFSEVERVLKPAGRFVMAYLALNHPFRAYNADTQEHLRRIASTFRESPEAYLTYADYERISRQSGLELSHTRDLTDGVFPVRHAEMLAALRRIRSPSLWQRLAKLYLHRFRWKVDEQALEQFLETHVARHACRYFEYHLTAWRKPALS